MEFFKFYCWPPCIVYKFFKGFTNHRNKTKQAVIFSCTPFPTLVKTGTTDKTFQQSGKQDYFRHLLKDSGSM